MSAQERRLDIVADPASTVGPSAAASRSARATPSTAWSPSLASLLGRRSASSTTTTLSEDDTRQPASKAGSIASAGVDRKRTRATADWLLVVKPPMSLPHSPPPPGTSAFASAYGPPGRFSSGTLMPLQTTLSSQVALIARDYGLPSVAGLCVYVDIGYGTASADVVKTVRVTEEAWATLWRPYLNAEAVTLQMPIAGRIEFDIDLRRARWFCEWCSPSSGRLNTQQNHPSESTRHRTSSTFSEMALEPSSLSGYDALVSTPNASPVVFDLSFARGPASAPSPSLSVSPSPPRPVTLPSNLASIQIQGDSEKKDPNWTEQLNQLREIREHDLVEGLDHPSQIDSLDGTQSLSDIYAALTSTESSEGHPALAVDISQIAKVSRPPPDTLRQPSSPIPRRELQTTQWYGSGLYNPVYLIVIVPPARGQEKIQRVVLAPQAEDNQRTEPPTTCNSFRSDDTEAVSEEGLASELMKPSERLSKRVKISDDDDEDEQQVGILYQCEVNVVQPLADDDEDGSQSEPDLDEGDNGCQVFDLCTASDMEKRQINR